MTQPIRVAIVDYRLGNLFSVKHACQYAGMQATVTSERDEILNADAVLLPGVGAFGDSMETLHSLDLVSVLREVADSDKPLIGVCLGIQLLMTESYEFGRHKGLGIIEGTVKRFDEPEENGRMLKVPQVGWNRIRATRGWHGTLLNGVADNEFMYFVHSFTVQPQNRDVMLSVTCYGDSEFCSSLQYRNVFACQFHPERSGFVGLGIYRNLALQLEKKQSGRF
jgi:glutamine amidotransferase